MRPPSTSKAHNPAMQRRRGAMKTKNTGIRRWLRAVPVTMLAALLLGVSFEAPAQDAVARGKYLTTFGGCHDCHTPGYFFGKPDEKRHLAGSEVGFEIPGMGVFHGPNLTPDKDTGLGNWSAAEIVTALQTG